MCVFEEIHKRKLNPESLDDYNEILRILEENFKGFDYTEEKREELKIYCSLSDVEMPTLCTLWGGALAHSAVKILPKFSPADQWVFLSDFNFLRPDQKNYLYS